MFIVKKNTLFITCLALLLNGLSLLCVTGEQRLVVLPLIAIINIALFFFIALYNRRGGLPLFEIGTICMFAIVLYSSIPLIMFLVLGGQYNSYSSVQLFALHPNFNQMGNFAWYYVLYAISFAIVYLTFCGKVKGDPKEMRSPDKAAILSIFIIFSVLSIFFLYIKQSMGVDFNRAYLNDLLYSGSNAYESLPLLTKQILQNLYQIKMLAMLAVMIVSVFNWRSKKWRYFLLCWLIYESVNYIFNMGSRTQIMMVALSFMLLFHRFVRPFTVKLTFFIGVVLLCIFILFGLLRGGDNFKQKTDYLKDSGSSIVLSSNEFEALFAGTYDIFQMRKNGILNKVPWQVQFSDLLFLIPSQLLPIEKIDPQSWYLAYSQNPGYFMFNPIAQSIVGLGKIQLIITGGLLAFVLAWCHRFYIKNSQSFLISLFYLFLTVWSYYTIRSSSFGFLYRIEFHFIPFILLFWFFQGACRLLLFKRFTPVNNLNPKVEFNE